ncbi:hypothetical protein AMTRI_Chr04g246190 [Amborella trichopoda]
MLVAIQIQESDSTQTIVDVVQAIQSPVRQQPTKKGSTSMRTESAGEKGKQAKPLKMEKSSKKSAMKGKGKKLVNSGCSTMFVSRYAISLGSSLSQRKNFYRGIQEDFMI